MGSFMKNILMTFANYEVHHQNFTFGQLPDPKKTDKTQEEYRLTKYPSSSWREKELLQARGSP